MPIDLRECYFIGLPQRDPEGRSILLDNLDLFGSLHLDLQYSIFEDTICIRKTHLKQARVDLDYCQFKGLCQIYESKVSQLNLNHAELSGGLLINHSSFYDLVSADHVKAKGIFELSSNAFFQGASFQSALLNTRFAHVEANLFYSTANFNDSTITADNYFLNNYFQKDILMLNVDFQQSFSFADNITEGMIRLKSKTRKISLPPATLDSLREKKESRSNSSSIQNTSQLEVITQKINAISKRIRTSNSQNNTSSQSQATSLAAQHRSDPEEGLDPHQEIQANKSQSMNNEKEAFHAFLSFAEEDAEMAQALYKALTQRGLKIWFSKVHLKTGDSIINTINQAIHNSKSGIVLISPNTFNTRQHFPILELNSLLTRDLYHNKPFFPVYHEITPEQVAEQLILIGDRLATDTTKGIDVAARKLMEALQQKGVL
ncbi:MAG: toll/interleukin-1 receptor domain-containing protein [Cyanothece sp. SIO1E1]|nr:toll/interleukin-1 receptor domain-containing protein [Cyanothece sp. SIO1E1]